MTSMPTISTTAEWASSADRRSRSAPAIWRVARSASPRQHRRRMCRAGVLPIATSSRYYTRHAAMVAQTENLAYPDQMIDLDPNVRDAWGLPAPRLTYDWRRPNEVARVEFMMKKMEELGRAMGAAQVWRNALSPGAPG